MHAAYCRHAGWLARSRWRSPSSKSCWVKKKRNIEEKIFYFIKVKGKRIKIVRPNRQSNIRDSCQSIFSLSHPSSAPTDNQIYIYGVHYCGLKRNFKEDQRLCLGKILNRKEKIFGKTRPLTSGSEIQEKSQISA